MGQFHYNKDSVKAYYYLARMKALLLIATLFIAQAALVKCGDDNDGGNTYDCAAAYMWWQMNSGPQVTGLCPWLLVCLGIAAFLFSTGSSSSVYRRIANK